MWSPLTKSDFNRMKIPQYGIIFKKNTELTDLLLDDLSLRAIYFLLVFSLYEKSYANRLCNTNE